MLIVVIVVIVVMVAAGSGNEPHRSSCRAALSCDQHPGRWVRHQAQDFGAGKVRGRPRGVAAERGVVRSFTFDVSLILEPSIM